MRWNHGTQKMAEWLEGGHAAQRFLGQLRCAGKGAEQFLLFP
jgi:hypothetical protein